MHTSEKIGQRLGILVVCNSSPSYKRQAITRTVSINTPGVAPSLQLFIIILHPKNQEFKTTGPVLWSGSVLVQVPREVFL